MSIEEDDRATDVWNELLDAIPGPILDMSRDWLLFQNAFTKLKALGYSKDDCNDFLNANLGEMDSA